MAETQQSLRPADLNIGDTMILRGNVRFSRIFHRIEGEELRRDVENARQRGQLNPIETPYWKLALSNVKLIPQRANPDGTPDLTQAETYITQRVYRSSAHPEYGAQYNACSKSPWKPQVFAQADASGVAREIVLEGELDRDMDVVVIMEIFGNDKGKGIGIKQVMLMEPVRYFRPQGRTIEALGITTQPMSREEREAAIQEAENMAIAQEEASPAPDAAEPVFANPFADASADTIRTEEPQSAPANPFDNSAPQVAAINPHNIPGL